MRSCITLSRVLLAAVVATGPSLAGASSLTIDTFEEGAFSLQTSGPLAEDTQTGLSTSNVLSGRRRVSLEGDEASQPSEVSLTLTGGDDGAAFFRPSGGAEGAGMSVSFMYEFDTPIDLTGGGSLNRLVIAYSDATPALPDAPQLEIYLNDEPGFIGDIGFGFERIEGTGEHTVPFPAGIDFTQVAWIMLKFETYSDSASSSVTVSHFAAVPEPATSLLVASGVLGLAAGRRMRA
jgi:hypothetical protein